MNLLNILDNIIEQDKLQQGILGLRDKIQIAKDTDRKECGHCDLWMKSSLCPRERNVNGRNKGPSISEIACDKFTLTSWVKDLKEKRIAEIRNSPYLKYLDMEIEK